MIKILFLNSKDLLNKNNSNLEKQIFHSFWDMNNLKVDEKSLKINISSKFKSFLIIILTIYKAESLVLNKVKIALVGHNVYSKNA